MRVWSRETYITGVLPQRMFAKRRASFYWEVDVANGVLFVPGGGTGLGAAGETAFFGTGGGGPIVT